MGDVGGAFDENQSTDEAENSAKAGAVSQSGTVHGQATEAVALDVAGGNLDQGGMDLDDSSDYDEEPVRFRSLSEVYENTDEVDLVSDSEVEVSALLAVMEEPSSYQQAVGDAEWIAAMDSEMQSINKNQT